MDPLLLIELFVSLLFERRIILRSSSLGTLTDVCSAIESLLYPFKVTSTFTTFIYEIHNISNMIDDRLLIQLVQNGL